MMRLKLHYLINIFSIFLISLFVFGCSARKTQTSINKSETEKTEIIKSETKIDEKSETKTSTDQEQKETEQSETIKNNLIKDSEISITVEPVDGEEWSVYDFVVGNTVFKGSSKGKITFTNKLKIDSINESIKVVKDASKKIKKDSTVNSEKKTDSKVDSKNTEKEKTKDKNKVTDKKEPIAFNIGISIAIIVAVCLVAYGVYMILRRYGIIKK